MDQFTDKPIVVPWDFSSLSRQALDKAVSMAGTPDQIEIVHVTPYPASVEPAVVWGTYTEEAIAARLNESFHKETDNEYGHLKFTALFGDPGTEIGKFADERKAGLIVISSHGRTGITRFLLGSVAERVVRLAPCPVLVLRGKHAG